VVLPPKTPILGPPFEDLISATRFVQGFLCLPTHLKAGY
jgi:hypothetical protein